MSDETARNSVRVVLLSHYRYLKRNDRRKIARREIRKIIAAIREAEARTCAACNGQGGISIAPGHMKHFRLTFTTQ